MKKILFFVLIFFGLTTVHAIDINSAVAQNSTRGGSNFRVTEIEETIKPERYVDLVTSNALIIRTQGRYLQKELNFVMDCGLDTDGLIGPLSRSCVRAFQEKYNLTVDGLPGPQTRAKLNELYLQNKVIVNARTLNVRDNAGTVNTNVLTSVTYGDVLTVLDSTKVNGTIWYHILFNDLEGYVISTFVKTTFIEVDITSQTLRLYVDKELYLDTPITSGRKDGVNDSTVGFHKITHKYGAPNGNSDPRMGLIYYEGKRGESIHDASWRGDEANFNYYGGTVYKNLNAEAGDKTSGSHGCINTPYEKEVIIFNNVSIGTPVLVY